MSTTTPRCCIVYDEGWPPEMVRALQDDPNATALQRGLEELAVALGELVDRPDDVSLIAAAGLAEAVQRRQPDEAYDTERGSGRVAARTMQRADGHIEIIIETGFLGDLDADGQPRLTSAGGFRLSRDALAILMQTVVHEAQHATMHQRSSDWDQFEIETRAGAHP